MTFLHTADWQLGKPFAGVGDDSKRVLLQQQRIAVLHRIGEAARAQGARFILVAGDLFDSSSATKATVSAACAAIGGMEVPVFVIPGNHDHGGPGTIWSQAFFERERAELAPNLRVLLTPEPVVLEAEGTVIFPCPLLRRHELSDTTAWLRSSAELERIAGGKSRILLAHGSVQAFGSGGSSSADADLSDDGESASSSTSVNRIDLTRLPLPDFDYIALGDWHGVKQVGEKARYSGTPEPDRFPRGEGYLAGQVLAVTVQRGAPPQVRTLPTGLFAWHQLEHEFIGEESLTRLEEQITALIGTRAQQDLLQLALRGPLGMEAAARLREKLESWESRLLRVKLQDFTTIAPSPEELEALTQRTADPLIARVAAKLVALRSSSGTGSADARATLAALAIQELHALCLQR